MYMLTSVSLDGVSRTAIGVARVRARESTRADRLFDDPYAASFAALGEEPTEAPSPARLAIAFRIIMRTRFYDDWLRSRAAAGCRQFVLLGAGLDTRGFRLAWPDGTRLFELDLPAVLDVKDAVLRRTDAQPTCDRHAVAADLTTEWAPALLAAGFDPGRPTAWLAEGLLVYLDATQTIHILDTATALSAAGSGFATEALSGDHDRLTAPDMVATTSMWQGGLGPQTAEWLHTHGWTPQTVSLGDVARGYGRPASREPRGGFITATR